MFRLFTLFVCLTSVVYGNPLEGFQNNKFNLKIFGGYSVNISEIPYQVSFQNYYGYNTCQGILISKYYVLTSATCLSYQLIIRIGSTSLNSGGVLVKVEKFYDHPQTRGVDYDFGILELENWNSTNVTFGFAKLPKQDEDVQDGELLRVSGWGNTHSSSESSNQLRAINVPKLNQDVCKKDIENLPYTLTDRMICAGTLNSDKGVCAGDGGGPLVTNNDTVVGIVSWGLDCKLAEYPGVYARVASVRGWIREITGI